MKVLLYPAFFVLSIAGGYAAAQTAQTFGTQSAPETSLKVLETSYNSGTTSTQQADQPLAGAGCGV